MYPEDRVLVGVIRRQRDLRLARDEGWYRIPLAHWPREQVIKCLVHYHPDDEVGLRLEQEARVAELWEATRESGHELLLEIIPPRELTVPGTADAAVLRSIKRLYNLGFKPEWWKLAPMAPVLAAGFAQALHPIVKGFMVGRTLWAGPSLRWLKGEIDDDALVDEAARNFATLVDAWRASRKSMKEAA